MKLQYNFASLPQHRLATNALQRRSATDECALAICPPSHVAAFISLRKPALADIANRVPFILRLWPSCHMILSSLRGTRPHGRLSFRPLSSEHGEPRFTKLGKIQLIRTQAEWRQRYEEKYF